MVKKLEQGEKTQKQPLKKAKNFFWRVIQLIFGILFVCSIVACVLFATGIIAIVEDGQSGEVRLRFVSPLSQKAEESQTNQSSEQNNSSTPSQNTRQFDGDNIGWGPTVDKECEEGNSTCEANRQKLPSIANYDLDIDGLIYNAGVKHPGESLNITDIRFTSNGRYAVAKLVSNLVQENTVAITDLYYYRSTYDSQGWSELKGLGNNQKLNCTELSDIQKMVIEDVYGDRGCEDNNNY